MCNVTLLSFFGLRSPGSECPTILHHMLHWGMMTPSTWRSSIPPYYNLPPWVLNTSIQIFGAWSHTPGLMSHLPPLYVYYPLHGHYLPLPSSFFAKSLVYLAHHPLFISLCLLCTILTMNVFGLGYQMRRCQSGDKNEMPRHETKSTQDWQTAERGTNKSQE